MKLGAIFPQTEIGADPIGIHDYIQAVEDMGYDHLVIYDHVVGADTSVRPDWRGPYTSDTMFHEPMVLYGYAAAVSKRLELVTAVIIISQRQTVLAAKQAAEVDVLSGGRLRFGVGTGWNAVEYEALGENFHNRGKRSEEQINLMRELWTKPVVTFEGKWHKVTAAGLNPLPVQRPIPIWLGGRDDRVLERVVRMADGWFPLFGLNAEGKATMEKLRAIAAEHRRDFKTIGIEGRVDVRGGNQEIWNRAARDWKAEGASHMMVNTMGAGLKTPADHIEALRKVKPAITL
jgi:probable F420-dependent oxidoreductase